MTAPVGHGYPDFGRYQARADKRLLSEVGTVISVDTQYPLGFVGDVEYLAIYFTAATNHFSIFVDFYEDAAYTSRFDGYAADIRQDTVLPTSFPVMGPFARLSVNPSAASSEFTCSMWTMSRAAVFADLSAVSTILLSIDNDTVLAGATDVFGTTTVLPGEASFVLNLEAAVSWRARLFSVDRNGTLRIISYVNAENRGIPHNLFLPPTPLRLEVFNNDASNRALYASLSARPIESGR